MAVPDKARVMVNSRLSLGVFNCQLVPVKTASLECKGFDPGHFYVSFIE